MHEILFAYDLVYQHLESVNFGLLTLNCKDKALYTLKLDP
jgi:hypothetical protein